MHLIACLIFTAVAVAPTTGSQISVGMNSGKIQIWDATTCVMVREMHGHESRVGTMAWSSTLLASGSRDRNIYLQDIRIRSSSGSGSSSSSNNNSRMSRSGTTRESSVSVESSATVERIARGFDRAAASDGEEMDEASVGATDTSAETSLLDSAMSFERASRIALPDEHVAGAPIRPTSRRSTYGGYGSTMDAGVRSRPSGDDPLAGAGVGISWHPRAHSSAASAYRRSTGSSLFSAPPIDSLGMSLFGDASSETSGAAATPSSVVRELAAHKQEVCGLKWSFDEKMLASGGNDNKLFVWEAQQGRLTDPLCRFEEHTAAVKAVAWSPHQHGLLASGGGTADRHIRFWNASTSLPLHKIDTGSQVHRIAFLSLTDTFCFPQWVIKCLRRLFC